MLGERRILEKFADTHVCPDCPRSLLVVRWSPKDNKHEVYCPLCKAKGGFVKARLVMEDDSAT
jgi:hypothetical protein